MVDYLALQLDRFGNSFPDWLGLSVAQEFDDSLLEELVVNCVQDSDLMAA